MEDKKIFELNDESLEEVAGGRYTYGFSPYYFCAICKNACSNCGGHDFRINERDGAHYHGTCKSCGTYNQYICRIDYADAQDYIEYT